MLHAIIMIGTVFAIAVCASVVVLLANMGGDE